MTRNVSEFTAGQRIDCGGIPVEVAWVGHHTVWLSIDTWDRSTARVVAENFGQVVEADETEDGRWSFAVEVDSDGVTVD